MSDPTTWRTVGVSSRGTSHLKTGDPCQDAHASRVLPCGTLVVAVADGAGTAPLADIGATLAVTTALETLCRALTAISAPSQADLSDSSDLSDLSDQDWKNLLAGALATALRAVDEESATRQVPSRDLACTLLLAVAVSGELVAAVQIGDGAVVARNAEGEVFAVTRPAPGEYLNETTFLVSPGALDSASFAVCHGHVTSLAALTDGLQMLALRMPAGDPHSGFFDPLFRFVAATADPQTAEASLQAFLDSPRVRDRADDDLTLFLAASLTCP